jgi:dihydroorotate dehydrogenase
LAVLSRLNAFKEERNSLWNREHVLGINIGKNKQTEDPLSDYIQGLSTFAQHADYIVINISSPNTPGLRALQNKAQLEQLIDPVFLFSL